MSGKLNNKSAILHVHFFQRQQEVVENWRCETGCISWRCAGKWEQWGYIATPAGDTNWSSGIAHILWQLMMQPPTGRTSFFGSIFFAAMRQSLPPMFSMMPMADIPMVWSNLTTFEISRMSTYYVMLTVIFSLRYLTQSGNCSTFSIDITVSLGKSIITR